jgi:hypothetical protein
MCQCVNVSMCQCVNVYFISMGDEVLFDVWDITKESISHHSVMILPFHEYVDPGDVRDVKAFMNCGPRENLSSSLRGVEKILKTSRWQL